MFNSMASIFKIRKKELPFGKNISLQVPDTTGNDEKYLRPLQKFIWEIF